MSRKYWLGLGTAIVVAVGGTSLALRSSASPSPSVCEDAGACNEDGQELCPMFFRPGVEGLAPDTDWAAQATAAGYTTASPKLGLLDCLNQQRAELSVECIESLDCRVDLGAAFEAACKYTRARGGVCDGIRQSPGSAPFPDCIEAHLDEVTAECQEAWQNHHDARPTSRS